MRPALEAIRGSNRRTPTRRNKCRTTNRWTGKCCFRRSGYSRCSITFTRTCTRCSSIRASEGIVAEVSGRRRWNNSLTHGFVLITAVLMETADRHGHPVRVLKYGANRLVNIGFGAFHTLFVLWSLITGSENTPFYTFRHHRNGDHPAHRLAGIRWKPAKESAAADTEIQDAKSRGESPAFFARRPSRLFQLSASSSGPGRTLRIREVFGVLPERRLAVDGVGERSFSRPR